jgi:hypothetical protein
MDIIPSFYYVEGVGGTTQDGLLPESNVKLRFGEVKREILPTDQDSYSKTYREYEVLVQHYEGGSATHRKYHHCMVLNDLCGLGDFSFQSLRVSDKIGYQVGTGSKVFILCIDGNDARGVIIGGPQQRKDTSTGIHKEVEFNGVNFQVYDDGSWGIVNKGKTDNLGNIDKDADKDGAGTSVRVEANGNFTVSTANGKCILSINHKDGAINIESSDSFTVNTSSATIEADTVKVKGSTVDIDSRSVGVGSNATEPAVLGQSLALVLAQAFGVVMPTLPTPGQQAALAGAVGQLTTILSSSVRVSR